MWSRSRSCPNDPERRSERCEEILKIQSIGLKKRLEHTKSKTVVLGISGGLDSTLALLVSVRAFDALQKPRKDILAVTMPASARRSAPRATRRSSAKRFGVTLRCIDISAAGPAAFFRYRA